MENREPDGPAINAFLGMNAALLAAIHSLIATHPDQGAFWKALDEENERATVDLLGSAASDVALDAFRVQASSIQRSRIRPDSD